MSVHLTFSDYLKEKVDSEVLNPDQFTDLPFRYTEVAKVLLDMCVSVFLCCTIVSFLSQVPNVEPRTAFSIQAGSDLFLKTFER